MRQAGYSLFGHVLLTIACFAAGAETCLAQRTVLEEAPVVDAAGQGESAGALKPSFETLGDDWIDTRLPGLEPSSLAADLNFESTPGLRGDANPDEWARIPDVLAPTRARQGSQASSGTSNDIPDSLVRGAGEIGPQSSRDSMRLTQAKARRAVVDAIARTGLGRALGRFLYFHQEETFDASGKPIRPARSWLMPRVSAKVNGRSRTVGVSFIWRF
jgi:hypothetical protein